MAMHILEGWTGQLVALLECSTHDHVGITSQWEEEDKKKRNDYLYMLDLMGSWSTGEGSCCTTLITPLLSHV
jgi:hypothetical protein